MSSQVQIIDLLFDGRFLGEKKKASQLSFYFGGKSADKKELVLALQKGKRRVINVLSKEDQLKLKEAVDGSIKIIENPPEEDHKISFINKQKRVFFATKFYSYTNLNNQVWKIKSQEFIFHVPGHLEKEVIRTRLSLADMHSLRNALQEVEEYYKEEENEEEGLKDFLLK